MSESEYVSAAADNSESMAALDGLVMGGADAGYDSGATGDGQSSGESSGSLASALSGYDVNTVDVENAALEAALECCPCPAYEAAVSSGNGYGALENSVSETSTGYETSIENSGGYEGAGFDETSSMSYDSLDSSVVGDSVAGEYEGGSLVGSFDSDLSNSGTDLASTMASYDMNSMDSSTDPADAALAVALCCPCPAYEAATSGIDTGAISSSFSQTPTHSSMDDLASTMASYDMTSMDSSVDPADAALAAALCCPCDAYEAATSGDGNGASFNFSTSGNGLESVMTSHDTGSIDSAQMTFSDASYDATGSDPQIGIDIGVHSLEENAYETSSPENEVFTNEASIGYSDTGDTHSVVFATEIADSYDGQSNSDIVDASKAEITFMGDEEVTSYEGTTAHNEDFTSVSAPSFSSVISLNDTLESVTASYDTGDKEHTDTDISGIDFATEVGQYESTATLDETLGEVFSQSSLTSTVVTQYDNNPAFSSFEEVSSEQENTAYETSQDLEAALQQEATSLTAVTNTGFDERAEQVLTTYDSHSDVRQSEMTTQESVHESSNEYDARQDSLDSVSELNSYDSGVENTVGLDQSTPNVSYEQGATLENSLQGENHDHETTASTQISYDSQDSEPGNHSDEIALESQVSVSYDSSGSQGVDDESSPENAEYSPNTSVEPSQISSDLGRSQDYDTKENEQLSDMEVSGLESAIQSHSDEFQVRSDAQSTQDSKGILYSKEQNNDTSSQHYERGNENAVSRTYSSHDGVQEQSIEHMVAGEHLEYNSESREQEEVEYVGDASKTEYDVSSTLDDDSNEDSDDEEDEIDEEQDDEHRRAEEEQVPENVQEKKEDTAEEIKQHEKVVSINSLARTKTRKRKKKSANRKKILAGEKKEILTSIKFAKNKQKQAA